MQNMKLYHRGTKFKKNLVVYATVKYIERHCTSKHCKEDYSLGFVRCQLLHTLNELSKLLFYNNRIDTRETHCNVQNCLKGL